MKWFHALAMYGDVEGKIEKEDEDIQILPKIIEKVLIPKLIGESSSHLFFCRGKNRSKLLLPVLFMKRVEC